jgi:flavodoxin
MAEKLVVYDSVFGNTEKIAEAIGEALGDVPVINVSKVTKEDLDNLKILFIGSPTRAFSPTPATMTFIKGLEPNALTGVKAAAFDTRIPFEQAESGFLQFMIKLFGYAETKIAKALTKAGGILALTSEGFGVSGIEGPLVEGELERAQDWARGIL